MSERAELMIPSEAQALATYRKPNEVLAEAHEAAKALQEVIAGKLNPVKFNNEIYLEFEDWQTVGRFYGVTARVTETNYVSYPAAEGKTVRGFEAKAVAVDCTGREVGSAESMCLDE